jgi:hypothetical protein
MKRGFIFFLVYFAAFAVPMGIAALLVITGPDPYVITGGGPAEEWLEERAFEDGSRTLVSEFDTREEASQFARRRFDAVPTAFVSRTLDVARYRRSDNDRHGLILPVERYVIHIEAPSAEIVEQRFAALDFVAENPEPNIVWIALTERAGLSLALLGLYVVFLFLLLTRGGSWAARIAPDASVAPVSAETLRDRLLAVNEHNQPFHIFEERPGRLVAEWRLADPAWASVMATSGLRRAYRFHLDLDEAARTVRVLEKTYKIAWGGGIRSLSGRVAFFQGITFSTMESGARYGLAFEPDKGFTVRGDYAYSFNANEIRQPLAQIVTGSGWTWRPVITFIRPIGG